MIRYILLLLLLCAVPGLGQTTFTTARKLVRSPYSDGRTLPVPAVRTMFIRDYQDAVRYQEWDNIRRIGRILTILEKRRITYNEASPAPQSTK